jgi:hypothetical protein
VVKKEKLSYVTPAVESCRVMLEASIVADVSPGNVPAQIEAWVEGDEYILGNEEGEGGDVNLRW